MSNTSIEQQVEDVSVQVITSDTSIIEVLTEGPQGRPGLNGSADALSFLAAYGISGHRAIAVVASQAIYADSHDPTLGLCAVGISAGAAEAGAPLTVQSSGELFEPSWAWEARKPVFCGPQGTLTQTAPTSGFCLIVGVATSPTSLLVGIRQPILL